MVPSLWLTIQIGTRRIPIPLMLLFPFALVLDTLVLIVLTIYGVWKKNPLFLRIASGFYLTRLTIALLLYGGGFRIGIHDENETVRIFGGLHY